MNFRNKFSKLFGDSKNEDQRLREEILNPSIECKTKQEFSQRMLLLIGGVSTRVAILQYADQHTLLEIEQERRAVEAVGGLFKIPSVITPTGRNTGAYTPYIIVFTYDKKLFVYPYDDEAFWV